MMLFGGAGQSGKGLDLTSGTWDAGLFGDQSGLMRYDGCKRDVASLERHQQRRRQKNTVIVKDQRREKGII